SASLNVVLAQRLVRRVCQQCKTEELMPDNVHDQVMQELLTIPEADRPKEVAKGGKLTFYRGKGCARCENTGYKGRIAVLEVLEVTKEVQKAIVSGGDILANIRA